MRGDRGVPSPFASAKRRIEQTKVVKTQRRLCARESLDTHEAQLAGRFALAVGHLRDEKLEIWLGGIYALEGGSHGEANFLHASPRAADFLDTDLTGVFGVTWEQIQTPRRDHDTRFPASRNVPRPQE